MNEVIISDYYPVYKDFSDLIKLIPHDQRPENPYFMTNRSLMVDHPDSGSTMLNAEDLVVLAQKCNATALQIALLLFKNSFEGHVLLNFEIKPFELAKSGTLNMALRKQSMVHDFYKQITLYQDGFIQIWEKLRQKQESLSKIAMETLVHGFIVNHFVRFPVSMFASCSILEFFAQLVNDQQVMKHQYKLAIWCERIYGEYEFIAKVNDLYDKKFSEYVEELRIKQELYSYFRQKLDLALFSDIHSEAELEEMMYNRLVDEKMNESMSRRKRYYQDPGMDPKLSDNLNRIQKKTKAYYRSVSKNCSEVHMNTDVENKYPELTFIFLHANSVYSSPVQSLSEMLLQFMQMSALLSKVIIYRKDNGYPITECAQLLSDINVQEENVLKEELSILQKKEDSELVVLRLNSFTDYKWKFVSDDELTEMHHYYLKKQLEILEQEIQQMQHDIKEVFRLKIVKPSK